MNAVVLLNAAAGRGRSARFHEIVRKEVAASPGVEIRETTSADDTERAARDAATAGVARVIAAGGDGTVHRVLNGIAAGSKDAVRLDGTGTGSALGIIPCGSGNDLAINLGIPLDIHAASQAAFTGSIRRIDLCRLECARATRHFACIASFGLDSHANAIANRHRGPFRGTSLYVWSLVRALAEFTPAEVRITHDGGEYRGPIVLLAAANASSYGGGMRIAPSAKLTDGLLDLVAVRRMTRLKLLWCFPEVFKGTHVAREEVTCMRTVSAAIEAERPLEIFADGEYAGTTPAKVTVAAAALPVIAP